MSCKAPKFHSPLAGRPVTREARDADGLPIYTVRTSVLTPLRAKAVDQIKETAAALLIGLTFLTALTSGFNLLIVAVLAVPAALFYFVFGWMVSVLFRRRTDIELSATAISRLGVFGPKNFDRRITHSFVLYTHNKAQKEQREHEEKIALAGAKGKVLRLKPYYGDSYHVCLQHGTTRRDLVEVYDIREAEAILQRLAFCDGLLNDAIGLGAAFHGTGPHADRGAGGFHDQGTSGRAAGGF